MKGVLVSAVAKAQLLVSVLKVKCTGQSGWGTDSAKLWMCTLSVVL